MSDKPDNLLLFGDNLAMLPTHVPDTSVDLVYLDPPFKSDANYNMLFKERDGSRAASQIRAFEDTWRWDEAAARAFDETVSTGGRVADALQALRTLVGDSDMLAYISMMAPRLVELRRVMKDSATLYLHCDQTASHYLKLILDAVFGPERFLNELTWKRTQRHGNVSRNYGSICDTILVYTKTSDYTWVQGYVPFTPDYIAAKFRYSDADGRRWQSVTLRNPSARPNLRYVYEASNGNRYHPHPNGWSCDVARMERYDREKRLHFPKKPSGALRLKMYLDESPGIKLQNLWYDIDPLNSQAAERLGYPTQKPVALLERIIRTSSNQGDVVLDPFCGCGTTIEAAEKNDRRWVGIDITRLAIDLIEKRLRETYPEARYRLKGNPESAADAEKLARDNRIEFQRWVLGRVGAPVAETRPGADRGIDGRLKFRDADGTYHSIIISVKSGGVQVSHLRDLRGVIAREKASIGVLVTMDAPTKAMRQEAASAGLIATAWGKHPVLQLLTVQDLIDGKHVDYPKTAGTEAGPLKRAKRAKTPARVVVQDLFAGDALAGTALSRQRRPLKPAIDPLPPPRGRVSREERIAAATQPTIRPATARAKSTRKK